MKSKGLLWLAGVAVAIAVIAYILGWIFSGPAGNFQGWGRGVDENALGRGHGGMMGRGGMMDGNGGMMGGRGMMGPGSGPQDSATPPLTIDQARDEANRYLQSRGLNDLKVREIIEFTNNFYANIEEQGTAVGAFELLIDRNSGAVYPEPGPGRAWNSKYGVKGTGTGDDSDYSGMMGGGMMDGNGGMMGGDYGGMMSGGMMGGDYNINRTRSQATTDMPVKKTDASARAQAFLDRQLPGAKTGEVHTFYGYYTIDVTKDGRNIGMLSVDGNYGKVWFHSWHGAFLSEKKF